MNVDCVLVNPSKNQHLYGKLGNTLAGVEPPLWMALLAAYLREKGFSVKIVDAIVEGLSPDQTVDAVKAYQPSFIGVGAIGANPSASSTPMMVSARLFLDCWHENAADSGAKSFLFGIHPSALPELTLQQEKVDYVIRGEAFYPVERLLEGRDAAKIRGVCYRDADNTIVVSDWADVVKDLNDLPMAAWDLLPMEKYRCHNWHAFGDLDHRSPYAIIFTSLGCSFHCHYCNIHALYSGLPGIRFRSVDKVMEEIDCLVKTYHIKHFKFLDELFVLENQRMHELCDRLIERNYDLNIWAYARIDTVNKPLLEKLRRAGVRWLAYGIEAADKNVRDGVSKGRFDNQKIAEVCQMTQDAGIYIMGNFMFGLPDDDLDSMRQTLDLAKSLRCEYVNFYTTMAYPGSALYQDCVDQEVRLPDSWAGFSQFSYETVPLPTKHLSSEQVLKFRDQAFREYFSDPGYLEFIEKQFSKKEIEHIQFVLEHTLKRKILEETEISA